VEAASKLEELSRALYDGLEHIAYSSDREEEATLSTIRLATAEGRERVRASLKPTVDAVRRFAREQSGRLTQAANRRAASLGIAAPVQAVAPAPDPRYAEASRMIVKRKRMGSITLDDLPPDQREGQPSGAWDATLNAALNWCDGKRNLAEVIRLTSQEHGPVRFNLVSYFRFLAKHGYVELIAQ
jgi:hypothetical protein